MGVFNVELKKVVDDSYEIEIGYELMNKLVEDLGRGLLGGVRKFAIITDSNVQELYAKPIGEKLLQAGFKVDLFVFPAGRRARPERRRPVLRMQCWRRAIGGTARLSLWVAVL